MTPNWMATKNVSRETIERLEAFHDLLIKWNSKINLVSKSSALEVWDRHIWDSAQVCLLAPSYKTWLDIGSGGGLPALVVAIMSMQFSPNSRIIMIESDQRKSAFLRTVIRELALNSEVLTSRAEETGYVGADIVSARALADLSDLLGYAVRHLAPNGTALFFKGETWRKEVISAKEKWSFSCESHISRTNPAAAILEIKDVKRV